MTNPVSKLVREVEELLGFLEQYPHQNAVDISGYIEATDKAVRAVKGDEALVKSTVRVNPFRKDTWNLTNQMRLKSISPALAARLEAEANGKVVAK